MAEPVGPTINLPAQNDTDRRSSRFLQPLTAALLECVTPTEVVTAVVERGVAVLGARAGLVALVTRDGHELEIVRTTGYASDPTSKWGRFPVDGPFPLSDVVRSGEALYLGDRADWAKKYPILAGDIEDTFQASVSLPLAARQRVFGAMHFSFAEARVFTEADRGFLHALAHQCALALERALLLEEVEQARASAEAARAEAEAARARQEFLSRASALLAESLDYQTTLDAIARLAVSGLCDWAAVDIVEETSEQGAGKTTTLRNLSVAHTDPAEVAWVREAQQRYPVDMTQTGQPVVHAITTGETVFLPDIPEEVLIAAARDEEHLRLIRKLDLRSLLCVPLTARGKTLGAVVFASTRASGRVFTPETVALVEELARRAAVAVDNARLFQSVEASEERYHTLFETAALGIVYQDEDAAIRDANPAAQHILGLTLDQMQGRTSMDPRWKAVREDGTDFPGDEHPVPRALRSGEVQRGVMGVFRPQDEAYRWLDVTAVPQTRAGADRPQLVYALFEDITERRRAEDERRAGEERFRALADNIAQLAWMADGTGFIFWYNKRWFDYTGTTLEEMRGWGWQKVHHPDYVESVTEKFRQHVFAGEPWEDTFPLRGTDGQFRWFLSRAFPIRNEADQVVLWCGTNTDVTEQRASEMRARFLADLTERTRTLTSPDAIVQETVRATGEFLGLLRFHYNDVDDEAGTCTIKPEWGWGTNLGPRAATTYAHAVWGAGIVADLRAGRTVVIRDLKTDSRTSDLYHAQYEPHDMRAVVRIPILRGGKWVALLSAQSSVPRDWSAEDVTLLETVTQRLWVTLENARLQREEQEAAEQQRRFLREMLSSMTERRLCLCQSEDDLPGPLPPACDPVKLSRPTLRLLRRQVQAAAEGLQFPEERAHDLITAVGEASMNAVVHGSGGWARVHTDSERGVIQVWVSDLGGGISVDALPRALERGVSTAGTLGHGFSMILKTADRIWLLTGPSGTTVVLEQERNLPEPVWL
jgi:PAS domain S-box-containing protein